MTNHGDDCYFFYYSTCTKGASCPFRHCEAAMGNEIVCHLWEEGRCFRPGCKFRHMKITHNRKEIACYWENQPAGCKKPHCAFYHEKPRDIGGLYVPPDKGIKKSEEVPQEELVPSQPTLPTAANPQVTGVKKSESQEPVASPTHPPVVINPADDDEDEDDQFSEEGEAGLSPRKQSGGPKSDGYLNLGVSTLEEINLRRALKARMKTAIYSTLGDDTSANGGKENSHLPFMQMNDEFRGGAPLRRSLAARLGRVVDEEQPAVPAQKSLKSVKQRLTLPSDLIVATASVETRSKTPEQIRVKTLEEIKVEKAAKYQNPKENSASEITISKTLSTKNAKGVKRAITVKDNSIGNVQTFSEMLHVKRKRQEENQKKETHPSEKHEEKSPDKGQDKADCVKAQLKKSEGEIRVKSLEEIRREKAARLQAQEEVQQATNDPEETPAKKPHLMRFKKAAPLSKDISPNPQESSCSDIKVKTFEEIMREKRLRKNVTEESVTSSSQSKTSSDTVPPAQQSSGPAVRSKCDLGRTLPPDSSTIPDSGQAKTSPVKITSSFIKNNGTVTRVTASETVTPDRQTQEMGTDTKVRPKLNVKPSVVKPSVHLKPGQKRKAPKRSAVAAVKPLNSTSTVQEPQSEAPWTDSQVLSSVSSDSAQSSYSLCNPVTSSDSACKSTPVSHPQDAVALDSSADNLSRTPKTSSQAKSRRTSVNRSSSSTTAPTPAMDEFDELMSEFTSDEPMEDCMVSALGEDDLLQELSDMIDS